MTGRRDVLRLAPAAIAGSMSIFPASFAVANVNVDGPSEFVPGAYTGPDALVFLRIDHVRRCVSALERAIDAHSDTEERLNAAGIGYPARESEPDFIRTAAAEAEASDGLARAFEGLFNQPARTAEGVLAKIAVTFKFGGEDADRALRSIEIDLTRLSNHLLEGRPPP